MSVLSSPTRINEAFGKHFCAPDWHWDTEPPFEDYDSWNVLGGRGELHAPGETFLLQAGDAFILRPGTRYTCRHDPGNPLIVQATHFDWLDADGRPCIPPDLPPLHRRMSEPRFFSNLLDRMRRAYLDGDLPGAERWLRAALWEIVREDAAIGRHPGPGGEPAARLEALCLEVRENTHAWRSVAQMAAAMGCHPVHLARLFRKHRGVSPSRFLMESRIEKARDLLRGSTHSVGRIAELVGYSDIYHFSRQFTAVTGQTPTAFRLGR